VAMGEARTKESGRQIAIVCLDELVPVDDRYRRIDEFVGDWGFVREAARPYYSERVGRPSIDPTVLLKLMVAGALEGIGSMRELLRVADVRLDLRLFIGYGLLERLREGKIRPVVAERLPLSETRRAHELLESSAAKGKLVLVP
jgi:hypothetical protein